CLYLKWKGPDNSYFVWEKNGQKMKACIMEQSHKLLDGRVHVLSWVKDAVSENTEYRCSFISKVGNTTSEVLITVEDKGRLVSSVEKDAWTKEFDTWRSAISEHDKMISATACISITKLSVFLYMSSFLTLSAVKAVLVVTSACSCSPLTKCSSSSYTKQQVCV
uniref:Ig-like domain-containing protein n=1 Tax=Ficedula albicollis TaxID=59894 RepID=A0A803VTU8_FICAL